MKRRAPAYCLAWMLSLSSTCLAQSARLQDERIYAGDIAVLLIEYENRIPSLYALDTTELEKDFSVLEIQSRTSRVITAEQLTNRMQWEVRILPRRSGTLLIPSIELGGLRTPELTLEVLPLSPRIESEQAVAIEVVADPASPLIGQQTNLSLRLLHNIPVDEVYWTEPAVDGADILRGFADTSYSLQRNGARFEVSERVLTLYPRIQGELVVSPAGLRATLVPDGTGVGQRQVYRKTEPLRLEVRDIPPEYSGRYWLPARDLSLAQRWETAADALRVGDSIGRVLTIEATGLPGEALPAGLLNGRTEAFHVYADQAARERRIDGRDLVGRLEQAFALILTRAGEVRVHEVRLKWWDVDMAVEREAVLPGRTLRVLPALPRARDAGRFAGGTSGWENLVRAIRDNPLWLLGLALLAAALIQAWRVCAGPPGYRFTQRLERLRARWRLRLACHANQPRQARAALLDWAALRWPDLRGACLERVATRYASTALDAELARLDRALYGPTSSSWDGASLWRQLRRAQRRERVAGVAAPARLAPLYPRPDK